MNLSEINTGNNNLKVVSRKRKYLKRILYFTITMLFIVFISRCESPEFYYRPDLPEQLCSIGIIDLDDTTLRHISFEKSFQSEYYNETDDSLRNFSFSISSSTSELFAYKCDSTVKNIDDLRIPDSILFSPEEKYYLHAKEKDTEEISAEVIATSLPPEPGLISATVMNTTLDEPVGCGGILDVRTVLIETSFEKDENLYYAILVKAWGYSYSSTGYPWPTFVDFSVKEGNTPGFMTNIKGLATYHHVCEGLYEIPLKTTTNAYFIEGGKIPGSECLLTLSIQYYDGLCIIDYIKAIEIKIISIPRDLYLFEKNVYTYEETSGDPFVEPVYINGNIIGGNGIFALCRSNELKITFSPWI